MPSPFVADLEAIRARARAHIERGAVTDSYGADIDTVVKLLNEALATEIVCVLRYKRHYFMADGIHAKPVQQEFLEHANEEQLHADQLAERIVELGGSPDFSPATLLSRSHAEYVEGVDLVDMITEDLVAERIAIDSYRAMIDWLGSRDATTRRLLESILAVEEQHAHDLLGMLEAYAQHKDEHAAPANAPQAAPTTNAPQAAPTTNAPQAAPGVPKVKEPV